MQHPEEGLIHAWLDGALPATEAAELEAHVATCSECAAAVAEARGLVAASSRIIGHLDVVPGNVIPVARPKKLWLRSSWPSAIAATILVGVGFYATRDKTEMASDVARTSQVIVPPMTDSTTVTPMLVQPQQLATRPTQRRNPQPEIRAMAPANEAPTPELQKAAAASVAPPPPAAPVIGSVGGTARSAAGAGVQSRAISEVVVTGTTDSINRVRERSALSEQRARSAEMPSARMAQARADFADASVNTAVMGFVGCYEMGVSTDILPSRFALVADTSTVLAGLFVVRYLDAQDNPTDRMVDAGWRVEGNNAVIRSAGRGTILTLTKTGLAVAGSSPNGLRSGRVISCR